MRKKHVKKHVKKALALSLVTAMAIPSISLLDSNSASAADMPTPVVTMDFERGFAGSGVDQAKVGEVIAYKEKRDDKNRTIRNSNGDETGEMVMGNTVLKTGTFDKAKQVYQTEAIPAGKAQQLEPHYDTNEGKFTVNPAANQPTAVYDANTYNPDGSVATYGKGNVFWLDDTREYQSYPTYATTVDYEKGTWTTDMNLIVKDTKGVYQEFDIYNSAAEFNNPFVGANATGFTLASWIKNTKPYKAPVTYGKMGDLNGDNKISVADALAVLMHLAEKQLLSENGQKFADVNGNGKPDVQDALMMLMVAADKLDESDFAAAPGSVTDKEVPLENTEFFHIEDRTTGKDVEANGTERDVRERQYLYFAADGVTYVGDFKDAETVCTWKVPEDKVIGEGGLLNAKNGEKWNYISYSFDGTDFTMYVNGEKVELEKTAGANYNNNILSFVSSKGAKTYLGGLGGGVKGNFNTYAIRTSDDYYMDDIAVYTSALSEEQSAQAYQNAETAKTTAENIKAQKVGKTYDFEGGSSLEANGLTKVPGAKADYVPVITPDQLEDYQQTSSFQNKYPAYKNISLRGGKVLRVKKSRQTEMGGLQLQENPFAGQSNLTGVTISYWMRPISNKRNVVDDGVLVSFLDDAKECKHEKVTSEAYLGANAIARSQLYFNAAYIGQFIEGNTKPLGTNSLKNIYTFMPYRYGKFDEDKDEYLWDKGTYNEWLNFKNDLGAKWSFVTITINNSGFKMYLDGEEVENKYVSSKGERFYDSYWSRVNDAFKKGTNNANARSLMDFITDPTMKVYIGFAYEASSETNYQAAADCYLDELSFYNKDMTKAEVKALYESVK